MTDVAASVARAILGHLDRLGGMLLSPRATIRRLLAGREGHAGEVFLWLVVLVAAASPVRTGRALLVGRVGLLDGVNAFLVHHRARLLPPLVAVVVAAALLMIAGRARRLGFWTAFDTAAFLLVPALLLMATGIVLGALGVEVWFFPHRLMRGSPLRQAVFLAVSYGWSLTLLGLTVAELRR